MNTADYLNQLNIVSDWIKAADQKISIFIAIIIGTASIFSGQLTSIIREMILSSSIFTSLVLALWLTASAWILLKLLSALRPSIKNKTGSPIFFGNIAKHNYQDFRHTLLGLNRKKYDDHLVEQIYTNSKICAIKHKLLTDAIMILPINIVLLFILIFINGVY